MGAAARDGLPFALPATASLVSDCLGDFLTDRMSPEYDADDDWWAGAGERERRLTGLFRSNLGSTGDREVREELIADCARGSTRLT